MIPLIFILILFSFLQEAFLPFNLVLLALVSRAFVVTEKENYYLAFIFGLILSFLAGYPLGSLSIIYLILVLIIHIFRKIQFAHHPVVVIPVAVVALLVDQLARSLMLGSNIELGQIPVQIILVIPVYFAVLLWEERFIVRKEIKLKVGK
ncbi:MAG: hypothetical protein WCV81_04655 [Microgenomates group bacterium]|jgi:cell shape-determining protein MreD